MIIQLLKSLTRKSARNTVYYHYKPNLETVYPFRYGHAFITIHTILTPLSFPAAHLPVNKGEILLSSKVVSLQKVLPFNSPSKILLTMCLLIPRLAQLGSKSISTSA